MKKLIMFFLAFTIGISANAQKKSKKVLAEETAILANFKKQEDCWNKGSIDCYMEAYEHSDDIQTISRGGVTKGYENIRQSYLRNFPKDRMGKLHFDNIQLKRLSKEYYYVIGRFNLNYEEGPEPIRGWFSVIMQKIDGQWLMISDHSS